MSNFDKLYLVGLNIDSDGAVIIQEKEFEIIKEDDLYYYLESPKGTVKTSKKHLYRGESAEDIPNNLLFTKHPSFTNDLDKVSHLKRFLFDLAVKRLRYKLVDLKKALNFDKTAFFNEMKLAISEKFIEVSEDNQVIYAEFAYDFNNYQFELHVNLLSYVTDFSEEHMTLFDNRKEVRKASHVFNEVQADYNNLSCFTLINDLVDLDTLCLRLFTEIDLLLHSRMMIEEKHIENLYFKQVL